MFIYKKQDYIFIYKMYLFAICISWITLEVVRAGFLDKPHNKIVNGQSVSIKDYPYQVKVYTNYHSECKITGVDCGGSILNKFVVITAAHCTDEDVHGPIVAIYVEYGTSFLKPKSGTHVKVKDVRQNNFDSCNMNNDIAILLLEKPIIFSSKAQPIELSYDLLPVGQMADATGFGVLVDVKFCPDPDIDPYPSKLQHIQLKVLSNFICKTAYKNKMDSQFCAIYNDDKVSVCYGDSGGPLAYDGKLIGIVSYGEDCAITDYPSVFTSIRAMRSFIEKTLKIFEQK